MYCTELIVLYRVKSCHEAKEEAEQQHCFPAFRPGLPPRPPPSSVCLSLLCLLARPTPLVACSSTSSASMLKDSLLTYVLLLPSCPPALLPPIPSRVALAARVGPAPPLPVFCCAWRQRDIRKRRVKRRKDESRERRPKI